MQMKGLHTFSNGKTSWFQPLLRRLYIGLEFLTFLIILLFTFIALYSIYINETGIKSPILTGIGIILTFYFILLISMSLLRVKVTLFSNEVAYYFINNNEWWSKTRLFWTAIVCYVLTFTFEMVWVCFLYSSKDSFEHTIESMSSSASSSASSSKPIAAYSSMESLFAQFFNVLFFNAIKTCITGPSIFYWDWINQNCNPSISSTQCMACENYLLSFCGANENQCATADSSTGYLGCPYSFCRYNALSTLTYQIIIPLAAIWTAVMVLQLVNLLLFAFVNYEELSTTPLPLLPHQLSGKINLSERWLSFLSKSSPRNSSSLSSTAKSSPTTMEGSSSRISSFSSHYNNNHSTEITMIERAIHLSNEEIIYGDSKDDEEKHGGEMIVPPPMQTPEWKKPNLTIRV